MAASLDRKEVDDLIEKLRALGENEQRRVDELEEQNENLLQEICSSLTVPTAAFGISYARAYYGEKASIWGIPIDAGLGLILHGLAACFGFAVDKGVRRVGKFFHDIANGALASWTSSLGTDLGAKKRMEKTAPAPQPIAGADEMPGRAPRPMTHEELAELKARMEFNARPTMPERPSAPPVHAPPATPPPMPIHNMEAAAATPPAPVQQSGIPEHSTLNAPPIVATAKIESAAPPPAPPKKYRFTQGWTIDPEAEMRRLLQSQGAPSDPQTVASVLYDENPMEVYRAIVRKARAPA